MRHRGPEAAEDAGKVDFEQAVPTRIVEIGGWNVASMAAFATTMSIRPNSSIVRATAASTESVSTTSTSTTRHRRPGLDRGTRLVDVVRVRRVPAGDDVRTCAGEDACRGGTDSRRRTGDQCHSVVEPEGSLHRASSTTPKTMSAVPRPRMSVIFSARNSADPITVTIGYADVTGVTWLAGPFVSA